MSITRHVCVNCSLRHLAFNLHAPSCHMWCAPLYNIFPHYLTNGTIFEKKFLNTKCFFLFSLQLLSETFLILKINKRDMIKKCTLTEVFLNLTEIFPCFFLSCKANARVKLAKTGHGLHSSTLVICVVRLLFVLFYYCLCVNVYCHRVTTQ